MLSIRVALLLSAVLSSGCFTYRYHVKGLRMAPGAETVPPPAGTTIDGATVARERDSTSRIIVTNKTDATIYVVFSESSLEFRGQTFRALPGAQRRIHSDMVAQDQPVAPHGRAVVDIFTPDDATNRELDRRPGAARYRIALRSGSERLGVVTLEPDSVFVELARSWQVACYVTAVLYGGFCWVAWVATPGDAEDRAAAELAARSFGAVEADVEYISRSK